MPEQSEINTIETRAGINTIETRAGIKEIFCGLRALAESAFPKRCGCCGREYASAAEFVAATQALRADCSGLKHGWDDDDQPIVDLFRNCKCGSTLMQSFSDRRDMSEAGIKRRQHFGRMLGELVAQGVVREIACAELLKFMRGEPNELLRLVRRLPAAEAEASCARPC